MPNLKVHLEVARRICEGIELNKRQKDLIMFGSILPDVNPGDVIKDVKVKISHLDTHFEGREKSKSEVFLEKYNESIQDNYLMLGYYIHLFTDVYWTSDFFKRVESTSYKDFNFEEKTKVKQNDFALFDEILKDTILEINDENIDEIIRLSKEIKEIDISKEEVYDAIEISKSWPVYNGEYKVYRENELKILLNETVRELLSDILKILNKI